MTIPEVNWWVSKRYSYQIVYADLQRMCLCQVDLASISLKEDRFDGSFELGIVEVEAWIGRPFLLLVMRDKLVRAKMMGTSEREWRASLRSL